MNIKIVPATLLALSLTLAATAQTKEKLPKEKEESITIRKKADSKEKLTIVIDGDKITVNGKPIEDLKDKDVEIIRNKVREFGPMIPRIAGRVAPMGGMKMFSDNAFLTGNRAFLGVVSEKMDKGVKINSIEKESAAEKAGLKKDDIITKVGDTKIESSEDLYKVIGDYKPADKVTITYLRDGKEATANATLGKSKSADMKVFNFNNNDNNAFNFDMQNMPKMNGMDFNFNRKPKLGLEIQDVEEGKGVKVLDVDSDTPASKAGLQKDDIITEIDGKSIASVDDLRSNAREMKEGDSIKLTYQRNGKTLTTDIKLPKKLKTADL